MNQNKKRIKVTATWGRNIPCVLVTIFSLLLLPCHVDAQKRIITNTKMIGVGYNATQDTYLSPEEYSGVELRYMSHTIRQVDTCMWSRLIVNEGYVSQGKSRSKNGSTMGGAYHFQYGALRDIFYLPRGKEYGGAVSIGAQAELLGGFLYNTRNGNNPAQVRALIDIGPVLRADYMLFTSRSGKSAGSLSYEASCPLVGITFSPNYGQSYYEFSEGNYDHNIVPTTIVSTPSFRNQLTFTYSFFSIRGREAAVSISYLGDYRQQKVNSLKQHIYSSLVMIGLTKTINIERRTR